MGWLPEGWIALTSTTNPQSFVDTSHTQLAAILLQRHPVEFLPPILLLCLHLELSQVVALKWLFQQDARAIERNMIA